MHERKKHSQCERRKGEHGHFCSRVTIEQSPVNVLFLAVLSSAMRPCAQVPLCLLPKSIFPTVVVSETIPSPVLARREKPHNQRPSQIGKSAIHIPFSTIMLLATTSAFSMYKHHWRSPCRKKVDISAARLSTGYPLDRSKTAAAATTALRRKQWID